MTLVGKKRTSVRIPDGLTSHRPVHPHQKNGLVMALRDISENGEKGRGVTIARLGCNIASF